MSHTRPITVVLVDDSLFVRVLIKRMVDADPRFRVVGEAKDGKSAVELVERLRPDVVTMDVNMPGMDGVATVVEIMKRRPTPVVMLSAHTGDGARVTLDALSAGAVDFLKKPSGEVSSDLSAKSAELLEKLAAAARAVPRAARVVRRPSAGAMPRVRESELRRDPTARSEPPPTGRIVVLGTSTGGPSSLLHILPQLPSTTPLSFVVVQHMPAGFTGALAERLDGHCSIEVREAETGMRARRGVALVAPGERHLELDDHGVFRVTDGPTVNGCKPSVDVTMSSVARHIRRRAIGVLMTGMGRDGAEGLHAIKTAGGLSIAQDEASCVIFGMPRAAIELGVVDEVLSLDAIAKRLVALGED